jgi:hypothetical protein
MTLSAGVRQEPSHRSGYGGASLPHLGCLRAPRARIQFCATG